MFTSLALIRPGLRNFLVVSGIGINKASSRQVCVQSTRVHMASKCPQSMVPRNIQLLTDSIMSIILNLKICLVITPSQGRNQAGIQTLVEIRIGPCEDV